MHGFVAQWIERLSPEQKVVGSIPIKPTTKTSEEPGQGAGIWNMGQCVSIPWVQ